MHCVNVVNCLLVLKNMAALQVRDFLNSEKQKGTDTYRMHGEISQINILW